MPAPLSHAAPISPRPPQQPAHSGANSASASRSRNQNGIDAASGVSSGSARLVVRTLITRDDVANVIGRNGSKIRKINSEAQVRTTFSPNVESVEDRIMTITGPVHGIAKALRLVVERIIDSLEFEDEQNGQNAAAKGADQEYTDVATVQLLIPDSMAGAIIGKGGGQIKDVQKSSKSKVMVGKEILRGSTEKILSVQGTSKAIEAAMLGLGPLIIEHAVLAFGTVYYNPSNSPSQVSFDTAPSKEPVTRPSAAPATVPVATSAPESTPKAARTPYQKHVPVAAPSSANFPPNDPVAARPPPTPKKPAAPIASTSTEGDDSETLEEVRGGTRANRDGRGRGRGTRARGSVFWAKPEGRGRGVKRDSKVQEDAEVVEVNGSDSAEKSSSVPVAAPIPEPDVSAGPPRSTRPSVRSFSEPPADRSASVPQPARQIAPTAAPYVVAAPDVPAAADADHHTSSTVSSSRVATQSREDVESAKFDSQAWRPISTCYMCGKTGHLIHRCFETQRLCREGTVYIDDTNGRFVVRYSEDGSGVVFARRMLDEGIAMRDVIEGRYDAVEGKWIEGEGVKGTRYPAEVQEARGGRGGGQSARGANGFRARGYIYRGRGVNGGAWRGKWRRDGEAGAHNEGVELK
ncbi:hypothetical protein HDU93_009278 [Gonapodya sp. JEL0774]|nr:hypothetical protein HDU93_009278 [Gonapodya sp. JEL0774]